MKRRTFLKFTCWGGLNAYFVSATEAFAEIAQSLIPGISQAQMDLVAPPLEIMRPADLLNLRFEFVNLKLANGPALERIDSSKHAYIRVIFPPQHISEQAFAESGPVSVPPVGAWIAGPSRLVFRVPESVQTIPYTLSGLLSWGQLEPSLVLAALEPSYKATETEQAEPFSSSRVHVGGFDTKPIQHRRIRPLYKYGEETSPPLVFANRGVSDDDQILEPGPDHTAIEAPRQLILSPHQLSAWAHSVNPFTHPAKAEYRTNKYKRAGFATPAAASPSSFETGQASESAPPANSPSLQESAPVAALSVERTELWHTRLGMKDKSKPTGVNEHTDLDRTVRAVYSLDYGSENPNPESSDANQGVSPDECDHSSRTEILSPGERDQIVHLSADNSLPYRKSISARRLMLSPLGAWLDLRGDWVPDPGSKYDLESWTHRAVMGRDTFVRVVKKGYLIPFGHRASEITVTQRKFDGGTAYLRFFSFIVVREPIKRYTKADASSDARSAASREFPFRSIRLKTLMTPELNPVPCDPKANGWIMVNGKLFLFQIEAEDWIWNVREFMAPLNFVSSTKAEHRGESESFFIDRYNSNQGYRECLMQGQRIAYAPSTDGATSLETDRLTFGVKVHSEPQEGELLFYPTVEKATVRLSAACLIAGKDTSVTIEPFEPFVQFGFGPGNDQGQVFAQVPVHVPLAFSADRSGGVATPTMNIRGISRRFGIIGGPAGKNEADDTWKKDLEALAAFDMAKTNNSPADDPTPPNNYFTRFFQGAQLLGDISLGQIINSDDFGGGRNIPTFQSLPEYDAKGDLVAIRHRFEWRPSVKEFNAFVPGRTTTFQLVNETRLMLDGSEPTTLTSGVLTNFSITPLRKTDWEFVTINFGSFSFTSRNGEKPDIDIQGLTYNFINLLSFFNNLATRLEDYQNNFSDPPSVNVTAEGVQLGYSLGLPSVGCGAFTMKNMAFSSSLVLPFNGPLALDLAFASRDNPFSLAIGIFGGGGFVGFGVGATRLNYVEASLEAGAMTEMNFVVAKGGVYAMVGVHFFLNNEGDDATVGFAAYFRCGGALSVLHLITVSLEIYFEMEYLAGRLTGYGEIEVEVDVLFFSKTVTLSVQKDFSTAALEQDKPMVAGLPFMDDGFQGRHESYWSAYGAAFADTTGGAA
jgi:hypothetical protein